MSERGKSIMAIPRSLMFAICSILANAPRHHILCRQSQGDKPYRKLDVAVGGYWDCPIK